MSVGHPLFLPGVGGSGHVEVTEGDEEGIVVINQGGKLVTYDLEEKAVLHTWYTEGLNVRSAVAGKGCFDEVIVVAVTEFEVFFASTKHNKLGDCDRIKVSKEVEEIVIHEGNHWVVFTNGVVEKLEYFKQKDIDDWVLEGRNSLLDTGDLIVRSSFVQANTLTRVGFLVKRKDGILVLVKGQLVLDLDTETHNLANISRHELGQVGDFISADLSPSLSVCGVKDKSLWVYKEKWEEVITLPSTVNCGAKWVGDNGHVAVMGSLAEGGYLHLVNVAYKAKVAEVKLKNTLHYRKGRRIGAMNCVWDRLYLAISNRLLCCKMSGLSGGLNQLLGSLAVLDKTSPYNLVPDLINTNKTSELVDAINQLTDLPEQLLIDCVLYFLDTARTGLRPEAQLCYLGILFSRGISEVIMEEELSHLSLSQVVPLLKLLDSLLHDPAGAECKEDDLLCWVGLLLNSHYLQLAVARDEDTKSVVKEVKETVIHLQDTTRVLADSRTLTHNIMNTKLPSGKNNNNLAYCIEVIQI